MKLPELITALTVLRDNLDRAGSPYIDRDVSIELHGNDGDELEVGLETDDCCGDLPERERHDVAQHPDHAFCEYDRTAGTWERFG